MATYSLTTAEGNREIQIDYLIQARRQNLALINKKKGRFIV